MNDLNQFFETNGHLTDAGKALMLDYVKDPSIEVPAEIRAHVDECSICRQEIFEIANVFESAKDPSKLTLTATLFSKKDWKYNALRIAAALVPLILLGGYYIFFYEKNLVTETSDQKDSTSVREKPSLVVEQPNDTIKPLAKKSAKKVTEGSEAWAANFEPNPSLEYLIGAAARSEQIEITSPAIGVHLQANVVFEWRSSDYLLLKILDNHGNTVFEKATTGNRYMLEKKLNPGLYYWKLESNDDLVYLGKFFIDISK